jgi:hypothetical protein
MAALGILAVLAAALGTGAYLISLRRHPWWKCRRCEGSGKARARSGRGAYGTCPGCGGRGRKPRAGIRFLDPGRAREMIAPPGTHRKADKRGGN